VKIEPKKTHLLKEFKHDAPLLMCKYDSTGRFVFAGGRDQLVHRWEIATGKRFRWKVTKRGFARWPVGSPRSAPQTTQAE
jgi:hypothetical protein